MSLEESELQELVAQSKESEKMISGDREIQKGTAEREEWQTKWMESMAKHPRVGLLPSPELLTIGFKLGKDATDTVNDFDLVFDLMNEIEAFNQNLYCSHRYSSKKEPLNKEQFNAIISLAFSISFAATRHTDNPTLDEYVIWYYTGHGRNKEKNAEILSMPKFEKVGFDTTYNDSAKPFAKHLQNKPVKGGELCLHHFGYCGLYGLIAPWIASVKDESQNRSGEKKRKHLIIILDSCYAGMIAQDLEKLNKEEKGPWNQNGCSISIQTACGPDEPTYGGYFTPCFVTLNKEQGLLDDLKKRWAQMKHEEKNIFCSLPQPSPKVVTTRDDSGQNNPTMEFSFNNGHKLTLFSDPGFFKFCDHSVFEERELKEEQKLKVLNESGAKDFMGRSDFTILDYKLKTFQNGPFAGSPVGLFLIEEPRNSMFAVCAHVHFAKGDTSKVGRINLVHHLKPHGNNILYVEDHDRLFNRQVKKGIHKIEYAVVSKVEKPSNPGDWVYWKWKEKDPLSSISFYSQTDDQRRILKDEVNKGAELVKACHDFVEHEEPGRWNYHTKWDMKYTDLSHSGKFRQKERSEWMEHYMKKHEKSEK